jgi:hypothetical protein
MQRIRRHVAVVSLCAMLGITGSATAARRNDGPRVPNPPGKVQNQQKSKPKGWIATILDDLANKYSIPPG